MSKRSAARPRPAPARAAAPADALSQASARLAAQRPLRDARLRQIQASLQSQHPLLAQADLKQYLADHPEDPDALSLLARVLVRLGQPDEAVLLLQRCLAQAPDFDAARYNLAHLLNQRLDHLGARAELAQLLARDGHNPLFLQMQAQVLELLGEGPAALVLCQQLVQALPQRPDAWVRLGHALRAVGQQADSVAAYRQAIALRPGCGAAYWSLANLKTVRLSADDLAAMKAALQQPGLAEDDRVPLQFALGKALEDQADAAGAFEQYRQGNAAMRQRIEYDPRVLSQGVARNRQLFTPAFLNSRAGAGCTSSAPIFVLGRPRSGSTLVEQILASHPAIEGTAELPYIAALAAQLAGGSGSSSTFYDSRYLDALAQLPPAELQALGQRYLDQAAAHRHTDRPHFIDKKPANAVHVGLIHLILPQARIIDVRRHPMACGLSMFKSYSSKGRLRLDELGRYYRDYVALMAHFDAVLPGRVLRVHYEDLVREPEQQVRRLLEHLGLPFDANCLRFHETERTLLTPSSEQVRRPINTDAVAHWRHFEPWLAPLAEGLGSALPAYPDVPEDLR
jgi:tetratricopeptide (TPR) repeat protein